MCCNRRLRGTGRALTRRRVSAGHRRRDDVLPRLFSVARLRRRRLRQRRQLVLVPRRAGDLQPRRRGAFHAADTPQTRLFSAVVTSRAPAQSIRRGHRRTQGSRRRSTCAPRRRRHTRRLCSASVDENTCLTSSIDALNCC